MASKKKAAAKAAKAVPFNAADVANITKANPYIQRLIEDRTLIDAPDVERVTDAIVRGVLQRLGQIAIAGGQIGARYGRRLPPQMLRGVIIVVGVIVAVKLLLAP